MHNFETRLASFWEATWPWPHDPTVFLATPETLARAGFFFNPQHRSCDAVQCFLCHKSLDGWAPHDDPFVEHQKHQGDCPWTIVVCDSQRVDPETREIVQRPDLFDDYLSGRANRVLSVALERARIATFGPWWPHEDKRGWAVTVKKMAKSGYHFTPSIDSPDAASCVYCCLTMDCWEPKDDPRKEHKRKSPWCLYFQKGKGATGAASMRASVDVIGAAPAGRTRHSTRVAAISVSAPVSAHASELGSVNGEENPEDEAEQEKVKAETKAKHDDVDDLAMPPKSRRATAQRSRASSTASAQTTATAAAAASRRSKRDRSSSLSATSLATSPRTKGPRLNQEDQPEVPLVDAMATDPPTDTAEDMAVDRPIKRVRERPSKRMSTRASTAATDSETEPSPVIPPAALETSTTSLAAAAADPPLQPHQQRPPLPPTAKALVQPKKGRGAARLAAGKTEVLERLEPPLEVADSDGGGSRRRSSRLRSGSLSVSPVLSVASLPESTPVVNRDVGKSEVTTPRKVTKSPARCTTRESRASQVSVLLTAESAKSEAESPPTSPIPVDREEEEEGSSSADTVEAVSSQPGDLSDAEERPMSPEPMEVDSTKSPANGVADLPDELPKQEQGEGGDDGPEPDEATSKLDEEPMEDAEDEAAIEWGEAEVSTPVDDDEPMGRLETPTSVSEAQARDQEKEVVVSAEEQSSDNNSSAASLTQVATTPAESITGTSPINASVTPSAPPPPAAIATIPTLSPMILPKRSEAELANVSRPAKTALLLKDPTNLLQVITAAEADMTVEEFIRLTIEQECDRLHQQCETMVLNFVSEAEKIRTLIRNL
ncbi:hypothetical protein IWQ60_007888 [Tieghemiomyces parasiticus]|uniref:Protein bir1 n=1 Tax=Tieghemiomyces parasiticus TaxID=78921 RepID=A0A9W8DT06_9FUNG|nr:hypothetical protein IWQ60_007888 [Tieghemiomyces parasiticus]